MSEFDSQFSSGHFCLMDLVYGMLETGAFRPRHHGLVDIDLSSIGSYVTIGNQRH
jgi:hypothetical protein